MSKFRCQGTTLSNHNCIHGENKSELNSGNARHNPLSSSLLSENIKVKIQRTIILPVVLYGCETRSLRLREERRLRVFENRVLRKIYGTKKDEVIGEWRSLHNIIRVMKSRMRWTGHVARVGRGAYRVLVGKLEGKRPLATSRSRWEDNIKMHLPKAGCEHGLD